MKRVQMHEGNCLREKNITHIQKKKKIKIVSWSHNTNWQLASLDPEKLGLLAAKLKAKMNWSPKQLALLKPRKSERFMRWIWLFIVLLNKLEIIPLEYNNNLKTLKAYIDLFNLK